VGGADLAWVATHDIAAGTPPRGRGRLWPLRVGAPQHGNTPAWAGPTPQRPGRWRRAGEHPRVGGADFSQVMQEHDYRGTPPRGRGRLTGNPGEPDPLGNTPAWAGPTRRP